MKKPLCLPVSSVLPVVKNFARATNTAFIMPDALILGIETSCDETGAAVVRSGEQILSNVVAS